MLKKTILVLLFSCFLAFSGFAQDKTPITSSDYANQEVEMADTMRSNGKIYIVVACVGVVVAGLFAYMVWVDRRLSKLEAGN